MCAQVESAMGAWTQVVPGDLDDCMLRFAVGLSTCNWHLHLGWLALGLPALVQPLPWCCLVQLVWRLLCLTHCFQANLREGICVQFG